MITLRIVSLNPSAEKLETDCDFCFPLYSCLRIRNVLLVLQTQMASMDTGGILDNLRDVLVDLYCAEHGHISCLPGGGHPVQQASVSQIIQGCASDVNFCSYKKIQSKLESIKDDLYKKRTSYRGALFRLRPLLIEINEVNTSLLDYNHYWRKITMTIFTSYITQMLFITYASVFFDIGTNVLLFTLTMIVNMFLLLSALCIDSATVVSRVSQFGSASRNDSGYRLIIKLTSYQQERERESMH